MTAFLTESEVAQLTGIKRGRKAFKLCVARFVAQGYKNLVRNYSLSPQLIIHSAIS